jgi:hypothetical protein
MAGDHFIVGWGRVETLSPALLCVDTGVAGMVGQDFFRRYAVTFDFSNMLISLN